MATKKKKNKKRLIKDLSDKRYILSLDLALANSGYGVYDLKSKEIVESGAFSTKAGTLKGERLRKIYKTVKGIGDRYPNHHIIKESCPQQAGKFTTVATLQGLAMAHAAVEMLYPKADNVHTTSIKWALGNSASTKKDEIRDIVNEMYGLSIKNLDESDAVAVVATFLIKFNKEIDEDIKELEKKIKSLSTEKAIQNSKDKITKLLDNKLKF